MKPRAEARVSRFEPSGRRRAAALLTLIFLALIMLALSACTRKSQEATRSPSSAPVAQLSPDTSTTLPPRPGPERKLFKTGEVVPAGYLGYKVNGSWFADRIAKDAGTKSATGYLYVDLSIVNTAKQERSAGPFKLIDEKGREFVLSEKAAAVEQSVSQIGKLAPSVSKRAFAIFEAPSGHQYKLRIPGFSEADALLIELSPTATRPVQ